MKEVAHQVVVEPLLEPLTGERMTLRSASTEDNARLDISASGVWGGRYERSYFDVRVFNPHAPTSAKFALPAVYKRHEQEKRRRYEERITNVEHASFSPVVLSCTGGYGKAATALYAPLASMLADKKQEPYAATISIIAVEDNHSDSCATQPKMPLRRILSSSSTIQ